MSLANDGYSQKHLGNFSSAGTISGPLTLSGALISNGQPVVFPADIGPSGYLLKAAGDGFTNWSEPVLGGATDVILTSVAEENMLIYNGSNWTNQSQIAGQYKTRTYTLSTTLVLDNTDYLINCTTTDPLTITLPDATTYAGKTYIIFKLSATGTGLITINSSGSDTVNDGTLTSVSVPNQYDRISLISNGGSIWLIV